MLIEVKVKVARVIDSKIRKRTETYLLEKEVFAQAEYVVLAKLNNEQEHSLVDNFEVQSLKLSSIKEVADQFSGEFSFIATLKDIFHTDDGTEKTMKYKVLLWANSLTEANSNAQQMAREGYDMQIEGIKQVDYKYLIDEVNE